MKINDDDEMSLIMICSIRSMRTCSFSKNR